MIRSIVLRRSLKSALEPARRQGVNFRPALTRGEALAEWERVTAHLRHSQIEAVDYGALAVCFSAWAMFDAACRELEDYRSLGTRSSVGGAGVGTHS
jgi:hypothetical protein